MKMKRERNHGCPPSVMGSIAALLVFTTPPSIPTARNATEALHETWRRVGEDLRAGVRECRPEFEKARLQRHSG